MQEKDNNSRSELWSLSVRDLFYKYVRFLPLFVLSVALTLFGAYIYLRYSIPVYRVGGSLVIKSEQGSGGRSDKFEDVFINDKAQNIQNEIEILKSRPLMQRVVDSLHLQFSYYAVGKIKTVNIYNQCPFRIQTVQIADSSLGFKIKVKLTGGNEFLVNGNKQTYSYGQTFKTGNGSFSLTRNPYAPPTGEYNIVWTPTWAAAGAFAGALQLNPKTPGTGILNISIMTTHPQMGADILNKLMEEYALYTIEQKREESEKIISFIDQRLGVTGRELDSIQQVLLDFKERNNLIDAETQSSGYFSIVSESDKIINEQTLELGKVDMVKEYLKDKKNEFSKVPSTLAVEDATLGGLVGEYNKVQIERQQLLDAGVTPDNPGVKETNAQIEKLRVNILESLKNISSSISSSISEFRRRSREGQTQLQRMPGKIKEQLAIEQNLTARQGLYKYLQEKREETAIKRASTLSNSNIVDKAYANGTPVKPNRKSVQILAILLGLGLPAL
ncbi:MAG TPA: GNVR domain-containing protein, partial [Chitinophagaceae bacterium]